MRDQLKVLIEAGSWEAAADAVAPTSPLTVLKFGDGWKAMYGQYDYIESYGYLLSCRPRPTVERACQDLIFRERLVDGLDTHEAFRIEGMWARVQYGKIKEEIVAGLKRSGWGNPLTEEQKKTYSDIMMHLSIAMGVY